MRGIWTPQDGPQVKAAICPANFTFFGGSRGGGKSDCLLGRQINGAEKYGAHWNGLIVRRKYKDFGELRRRIDELISEGLPAERVGGPQQTNYVRFKNGALITMPAIGRIEQANDYVGHQFTEISPDECTTFPFFRQLIDKLKGSLRSPHGVPCRVFGTGNPGGPGHMAVKDYFRLGTDGVEPETVMKFELGKNPRTGKMMTETRVFIPSFLGDNKILCENDPNYVAGLMSISDPDLRRAWIDGDWDVFIGQAFNLTGDHLYKDDKIPPGAPMYMTFDWGFGKPFSVNWFWVDADNRLYLFAEWYGWNGKEDEGLRLEDSVIAEGINEREQALGLSSDKQRIIRLSGPDCFAKKPDYKGGGQGPSTAEVFASKGIFLTAGDPSRHLKLRQFRERLRVEYVNGTARRPMLVIHEDCKHFRRTIPALSMGDPPNDEDIDTTQEDHIYDAVCHAVMARPLSLAMAPEKRSIHDTRIDRLIEGQDDYVDDLDREHRQAMRDLIQQDEDWGDLQPVEDGNLVATVN